MSPRKKGEECGRARPGPHAPPGLRPSPGAGRVASRSRSPAPHRPVPLPLSGPPFLLSASLPRLAPSPPPPPPVGSALSIPGRVAQQILSLTGAHWSPHSFPGPVRQLRVPGRPASEDDPDPADKAGLQPHPGPCLISLKAPGCPHPANNPEPAPWPASDWHLGSQPPRASGLLATLSQHPHPQPLACDASALPQD